MSESRFPVKGVFGLREPVNSLSAIVGLILSSVSYNSCPDILVLI